MSETEKDYHGHPKYFLIYIYLVVALGLSLLVMEIGNHQVGVALVFLLAIIKIWLVISNFMHLKFEPKLVWVLALSVFFFLALLFGLVYPDVSLVKLIISTR